jgi:hypothetical protein
VLLASAVLAVGVGVPVAGAAPLAGSGPGSQQPGSPRDVSDGGSTIVVPLPAGLIPVDVATGRQRDKVRAATTVRLASEPPRVRASGFEPTVVVTDAMGVAIEPDLGAARAGVAPVPVTGDEMTFTFDSPASPWTPAELASLQALLRDAYSVAKAVDGPPLFNLSVNVRKDPASPFIGYYNASTNEMTLRGLVRPDVVVHEMLHAFRDDVIMCPMTFEEGMTRAAEVEVMSRIPEGEGYFDLHHSYGYDVYYDALNDQRIGAANGSFFAGEDALFLTSTIQGAVGCWLLIMLCRFPAMMSGSRVSVGDGAARCARGGHRLRPRRGGLLSGSRGRGSWSGGCGQGAQPLPAGQERLLPGPGPAELEDALPGVADQPGGQRP